MTDICLDCLQKQKPWVTNDMAILSVQQGQCSECGQSKQLVYVYTETDAKLLVKKSVHIYSITHIGLYILPHNLPLTSTSIKLK